MAEEKGFLSVSAAAEICGVNRASIWRWIKMGGLKAGKTAGGHHRILKEDFDRFMGTNRMIPQLRKPDSAGRILVVDDDPAFSKFMQRFLIKQGYVCDLAADGFQAGIKTVTFNPDLVVLDLIMPNMDGFDVCRQIRSNPETQSVGIIAVSGTDEPENRQRILGCGADVFIPKPIDTAAMKQAVSRLLSP
ncbi:MAG: response regulator [Pseudomonadota bacterium]